LFRANYKNGVPSNRWLSLFELEQTAIDNNQLHWLSDYGSMTERLQAYALEPLKVELVTAKRQKVSMAERDFLDLTTFEWPYVREVVMHVDEKPWLVGRSVIPAQTINHKGRALTMLKNRPLGPLLFDGNLEARLFIEVAAITPGHRLFPDLTKLMPNSEQLPKRLWATRSLFTYGDNPLLVQEVFLPICPFKLPDADA
jgi:chorismate lyase